MNDEDTAHQATGGVPQSADPLSDLTLTLKFNIGEKSLSLQELQSIQPGYTFALDASVDKPVAITVNGQHFGQGELVQIGSQIGVKLLELTHGSRRR